MSVFSTYSTLKGNLMRISACLLVVLSAGFLRAEPPQSSFAADLAAVKADVAQIKKDVADIKAALAGKSSSPQTRSAKVQVCSDGVCRLVDAQSMFGASLSACAGCDDCPNGVCTVSGQCGSASCGAPAVSYSPQPSYGSYGSFGVGSGGCASGNCGTSGVSWGPVRGFFSGCR